MFENLLSSFVISNRLQPAQPLLKQPRMQFVNRQFKRHSKWLASIMASLVLLLDALVVSPQLHECLHHDAGSNHHQCAVTIFEQGLVDASSVEVASQPPASIPTFVPTAVFSVFAPAIENLPAGRAPPVSASNS